MRLALVVAAVVWPALLGGALIDRVDGHPSTAGTFVYLSAAQLCHQRPDRSFHTAGHQWPVCARCAGLYLSAPVGALAGLAVARARRSTLVAALVAAAVPTAATWGWEAIGGDVSGLVRAVAAAPLGSTLACALALVAGRAVEPDRID